MEEVLNIKDWVYKNDDNNSPQFEIIFKASNGKIYAVKRLKDGVVFSNGCYVLVNKGAYGCYVQYFNNNNINVRLFCKDNGSGHSFTFTREINDIELPN